MIFDLQACQTEGSAHRGVGRYSKHLAIEIAAMSGEREVFALRGRHHPHQLEIGEIGPQRFVDLPTPAALDTPRDYNGGERDAIDGILLSAAIGRINADIVHISHIFEGFADRVPVPNPKLRPAGQLLSATLYDLIPLRFQEHYFRNDQFQKWYLHRLAWYRSADLLLSISESSRQDAIDLLGLDPSRIVTIHGGISDNFRPDADRRASRERLKKKYGLLRDGFVLYTGGDDYRKNLKGAIEAYARLRGELRQKYHLVIVCAMTADRLRLHWNIARLAGLSADDIRFVGYVSDEDLVSLYSTCDLFFFPSLYEGLGLPVLEAMACGAPVLGGNNSSIKELLGRPEALFDSSDSESIAAALSRALENQSLTDDLRVYGLEHSAQFTWKRSAELALDAFDQALDHKRKTGQVAASHGWLPRLRLAVLTPLPPCRSGIADYNARFLPFLGEHFDIDLFVDGYKVEDDALVSCFRIFDAKDFPQVAKMYDAIVYELGNSEFHAYMLPLLDEFPGVVGLHDAYLSGLFAYLYMGDGSYVRRALDEHGTLARRIYAPVQANPDPIRDSVLHLPSIKRVLDRAIGVISHSPFNLELAREHYPQGWAAPYRIIPQMVVRPNGVSQDQRALLRTKHGFRQDDFIVATFGHITWTKWGDRIFDAVMESGLTDRKNFRLAFVGELAEDPFGKTLGTRVRKLGSRARITGYLSEEEYAEYLHIADLGIQLRTNSRGGTPKGVLDCLSHGVPVIVNNDASYHDYPDDVVVKLPPAPDAAQIGNAIKHLLDNPMRRMHLSKAGRSYVEKFNDPRDCAAKYAAAIHEFIARHKSQLAESYIQILAPHVAATAHRYSTAKSAAEYLSHIETLQVSTPRVLIDVSHIAAGDHLTGIQRVVKQIVLWASVSKRNGLKVVAVRRSDDQLIEAKSWLNSRGLIASHEDRAERIIELRTGDRLLMLDSSWADYPHFRNIFAEARRKRVPITTVIYDLLPITLPPKNFVEGGKEWFESWVRMAVSESDSLVCISRSVAEEVVDFVIRNSLARPDLKVGWWHLGSDLTPVSESNRPALFTLNTPFFLMVGTIEPRKGHESALNAFEKLWERGFQYALVIVGKTGWLVDALMVRIKEHPELNRRLFLFESASDSDVTFLYSRATGVLFLSKGEGFGLPLVEAAQFDIPLLCSDIPVFHEIAGDHVRYFNIADRMDLSGVIERWSGDIEAGTAPRSGKMPRLSWEDSAESLLDVITGARWYWEGGRESKSDGPPHQEAGKAARVRRRVSSEKPKAQGA